MTSTDSTIIMTPIGRVAAKRNGFALHVDTPYRPALRALEGFSHLNVLWWANRMDSQRQRTLVECEKPYTKGPDKVGVFATRSPARPNPIALTPVAVLELDVKKGIIRVPFIDADDQTPIVDIKPYHPAVDRVRDVRVPAWCSHWPECYEDSARFDWSAEFASAE